MFHDGFARDVTPTEDDIMATMRQPINQAIIAEKSRPTSMEATPYMVSSV